VLPHAAAIAPDGDEMAMVDEAIDQRGCHDIVAEDVAPLSKPLLEVSTVNACS
jgi:hypothetical protein